MKWVLVEWLKEGDRSVIPANWVLVPKSILEDKLTLPTQGVAYWKKPSNKFTALLLAISGIHYTRQATVLCHYTMYNSLIDSKQILEAKMDQQYSNCSTPKRAASSPDPGPAVSKAIQKRRVKARTEKAAALDAKADAKATAVAKKTAKSNTKKAKKAAENSTVVEAYQEMLQGALPPCTKCAKLQASVTSLEEELQDARHAIEAKKAQIANLQSCASPQEKPSERYHSDNDLTQYRPMLNTL